MRNPNLWKPNKYVIRRGRLRASRDPKEVNVASRLIADLVAECYDANLKVHARGRLLDLGCGKVPLYESYRDYISESICVDWEHTSHQSPHLDFETDLTREVPFPDGAFDTVILSSVLEHIPVPEELCREIARVLSPGGKLLMDVPFYYRLHEKPHDYYRYTEFALRRFMDRSGMQLLRLQALGGALEIMADVFAKNATRMPVLGTPAAILAQGAVATFCRTALGHRVSKATGSTFPLAYFLVAMKPATSLP
jgi:SAM-dependent methyltransferase